MMIRHIVQVSSPVRLDRYLRKIFPLITQGIIEQSIRKKKIKAQEHKTQSGLRVKEGDILLIDQVLKQQYSSQKTNDKESFSENVKILAKKIQTEYLVYESDDLIIINKPPGLATQGGSKITLAVDHAISYLNHSKKCAYKLVHRLDKNTSGLLVIAKNELAAQKLANGFFEKKISKKYHAILANKPNPTSGIINNQLEKIGSAGQQIVKITSSGKEAITQYRLLEQVDTGWLVEFAPITGRMHQLRVHSQFLGCPIVGDVKYGGPKSTRMMLFATHIFIPKDVLGYEIKASLAVSAKKLPE